MNAKTREEEYLRRMKALGYEPDLRGMDDDDIKWELGKMEEADRRREPPPEQPLRTVYRPVDPGLKARILRMFGQPYDESAIPKGQEFYLNGWDNGEDEYRLQKKPAPDMLNPLGGGMKRPEEPLNYWDTVLKGSQSNGNIFEPYLKPLTTFPEQNSSVHPTRDNMYTQYSYEPSGHDAGVHMKGGDGGTNKDVDDSGQTKESGDHYILYSQEDQRFYWINGQTGTVVNSWAGSNKFVPGVNENGVPRESLPIGTYEVSAEISDGKYGPAYGTFYITTGDPRGRDIHGGGTGLDDPYAPNHELLPTHGCLRMQNADGTDLSRRIIGQGNKVRLVVINGPAKLSGNDLR
ncbi:L,D-transpeptidase [Anaeroselena agilis]|uniref:L,D-transpeptidase n=1 Tax=Anaeroselena agilis TaxID=3063788 RepID=A0ABU3NV61_9FIRM|nr:L,D-transpeptidase [Selenomonadales bacterium 4137-cl]